MRLALQRLQQWRNIMVEVNVLLGARGLGKTSWVNQHGKIEIRGLDNAAAREARRLVQSAVPLSKFAFSSSDLNDIACSNDTASRMVAEVLIDGLGIDLLLDTLKKEGGEGEVLSVAVIRM